MRLRSTVAERDPVWQGIQRFDRLHDLLAAVDLVSLHAPLGPSTRGIIDTVALAAMKPGAVVVNAARGGGGGGAVDEAAGR